MKTKKNDAFKNLCRFCNGTGDVKKINWCQYTNEKTIIKEKCPCRKNKRVIKE